MSISPKDLKTLKPVLHYSTLPDEDDYGTENRRILLCEESQKDLFELFRIEDLRPWADKQRNPSRIQMTGIMTDEDGKQEITNTICALYLLAYGNDPEERTYAVFYVYNNETGELDNTPFVGRLVRDEEDDFTALFLVTNNNISTIICEDALSRFSKENDEILSARKKSSGFSSTLLDIFKTAFEDIVPGFRSGYSGGNQHSARTYSVMDGGYERILTEYGTAYDSSGTPRTRYRDDTGAYWISDGKGSVYKL